MPIANTVEATIVANFEDRLTGPSQKAFAQFKRNAESAFRAVSQSGVQAFARIKSAQQSALNFDSGPRFNPAVPTSANPLGLDLEPQFEFPSFASGINFVPRDMLANIHKGETVLPKAQAERFRQGGLGGDAPPDTHFLSLKKQVSINAVRGACARRRPPLPSLDQNENFSMV